MCEWLRGGGVRVGGGWVGMPASGLGASVLSKSPQLRDPTHNCQPAMIILVQAPLQHSPAASIPTRSSPSTHPQTRTACPMRRGRPGTRATAARRCSAACTAPAWRWSPQKCPGSRPPPAAVGRSRVGLSMWGLVVELFMHTLPCHTSLPSATPPTVAKQLTHRQTAAPITDSMIFSSRLIGPIFSSRSDASCGGRAVQGRRREG